jgi:hypothetical protein
MRHSWKFAIAGLAVVALMSFAAACGDDDNTSKDTATPAGTTTQAVTTAETSATAEGSATEGNATAEASSTEGTASDAIDDLQKSSDNFVKANYDVTYELTTTSDGKTSTSTMVVKHKDNKDYLAINGDVDGSGEKTDAIIIDDGTNSYICTETEKACLKTTSTNSTGGIGQMFTALKPDKLLDAIGSEEGAKVDETSGQKIAGRDAKCYDITSSEGNGTICFDKDTDIMLSLKMTNATDGNTNFEATKVGGSPGDDDFKAPYPVQDLGSGS